MSSRIRFATVLPVMCLALLSQVALPSPGDQNPDLNSLSDEELKELTITLERTACYGTCPAYSLVIHGSGLVEYTGKNHVRTADKREGRIAPADLKKLVAEFARVRFFSIPDDFSEANCTGTYCFDFPTAITEIKAKGVTHRVSHYHGCIRAPKDLLGLEDAIDHTVDVQQWAGDESKSGPFGYACVKK